jgi:hypothetical protein
VPSATEKGFCRSPLTSIQGIAGGLEPPTQYTDHRVRVYTSERDASASPFLLSCVNGILRMDLLSFNPTYNILICTSCKYAVHSTAIPGHLYDHHKAIIPPGKVQEYARLFTPDSLLPLRKVKQLYVPTTILPISHLRIYKDAYCCKLCPPDQQYVIRSEKILLGHLKEAYQ